MVDPEAIYERWKRYHRTGRLNLKYPSFKNLVKWLEEECILRGVDMTRIDLGAFVDPTLSYRENRDRLKEELRRIAPIEEEINPAAWFEKENTKLRKIIERLLKRLRPKFGVGESVEHRELGEGKILNWRPNVERGNFEYLTNFGKEKMWVLENSLKRIDLQGRSQMKLDTFVATDVGRVSRGENHGLKTVTVSNFAETAREQIDTKQAVKRRIQYPGRGARWVKRLALLARRLGFARGGRNQV